MTLLEDMLKQVDQAESELIELERALVQIPSVNTGFMPTGNETPVCRYISDVSYTHMTLTTTPYE